MFDRHRHHIEQDHDHDEDVKLLIGNQLKQQPLRYDLQQCISEDDNALTPTATEMQLKVSINYLYNSKLRSMSVCVTFLVSLKNGSAIGIISFITI